MGIMEHNRYPSVQDTENAVKILKNGELIAWYISRIIGL